MMIADSGGRAFNRPASASPPPPPPPPPPSPSVRSSTSAPRVLSAGTQPVREGAAASTDARVAYAVQARASGYDPATIIPGSAADRLVRTDLSITLDRLRTQGQPSGDGIASTASALRAEAGATVAMRRQSEGGPTYSATGAAQIPTEAGGRILRDNPILRVQWESTISPVNGRSGFTGPLQRNLDATPGVERVRHVNPIPPGSTSSNDPAARTANGNAARDAIADRLRADPRFSDVRIEVPLETSLGGRRVDVVALERGARPEMNTRYEIESKLGRASNDVKTRLQVAKDAERVSDNVSVRRLGSTLEGVGRVARPVGLVVDAVQVGSAFKADGNTFGDNTQRAVGSLAGGAAGAWGGAQLGAAIGSVGGPVGTVVGGVVGGVIGGVVGSGVGEKAVDFVKGWF